jgi:hypothetical protein
MLVINQEAGLTMSSWPRHPAIYEINTRVWLSSIGAQIGRPIDLSSVDAAEWDSIAKFGFEAVWLMGVCEHSLASSWKHAIHPGSFVRIEGRVYASGRDPYFSAWQGVLQLNAFDAGMRRMAIETVLAIAERCDGIRCDMAMLLLNEIFKRTWGQRGGRSPRRLYVGLEAWKSHLFRCSRPATPTETAAGVSLTSG